MKSNITFTIIKPDAVKNGYIGNILNIICEAGFKIIAMKYTRLTQQQAQSFYAIHKEKPFFENLTEFMCSGPVVVAILKKDNAVVKYRKLIGSTNPAEAAPNTIRKLYAESLTKNAVHGADSNENARIEGAFFFSSLEVFE